MRNGTRAAMTFMGIPLLVLAASALPAGAIVQLIHMHNGKILKAQTVEEDGDWLMATLEGGSTIGFPRDEVALVEPDPLGRDEIGVPANVVTSGRELPARATFPSQNRTSPLDRSNIQAAQEAQDAAIDAGVTADIDAEAAESGEVALDAAGAPTPVPPASVGTTRSRRLGLRTRTDDE